MTTITLQRDQFGNKINTLMESLSYAEKSDRVHWGLFGIVKAPFCLFAIVWMMAHMNIQVYCPPCPVGQKLKLLSDRDVSFDALSMWQSAENPILS